MKGSTRIIQYGVGSIGTHVINKVLRTEGLEIVGAIDNAPEKVGRDLGKVIGLREDLRIKVTPEIRQVLSETKADVMVHTTSSRLVDIYPELVMGIKAKLNIVSSSEELSYPYLKNPEIATQIDELAKLNNVTVIGTGVNPGFVMDTLILVLTGVCQEVEGIKGTRVVDVASRRSPLQKKVGVGLTSTQFNEGVRAGRLGHVGLVESVAMIASGLKWALVDILETIDPVLAEETLEIDTIRVEKGQVLGIKQVAKGVMKGIEMITLVLEMYLGAKDQRDSINIKGNSPIDLIIKGGIMGDFATVGVLVNSIPRVVKSEPGLITMLDLLPFPKT